MTRKNREPPFMQNFNWQRARQASADNPLRVLCSACLVGRATGWEGGPYTSTFVLELIGLDNVQAVSFCPEDVALGTPRALTTLHGGNGFDVLDGRGTVRNTENEDQTALLLRGVEGMVAFAEEKRVELAVLMEISDSCGTTAIYLGHPSNKDYQQGPGVAAAALHRHGVPIISPRDYRSIAQLRKLLQPSWRPPKGMMNFVETEWYQKYFLVSS